MVVFFGLLVGTLLAMPWMVLVYSWTESVAASFLSGFAFCVLFTWALAEWEYRR